MKYLIIVLLAISVTLKIAHSERETSSRIPFYILNAANAYQIDVNLMYAICQVESKCRARAMNKDDGTPEQKAAGIKVRSYGLFQLQIDTVKALGFIDKEYTTVIKKRGKHTKVVKVTTDNSKDLLQPDINSIYAAKLLHKLYRKYHDTAKVISAYNAGHYTKANSDYVLKVMTAYVKLTIDHRN